MMLNLTGAWELDKERSQSMYPHMKLLGCDEIAALASEKLNLKMHIIQTDKLISVWQQSQLGIVYRGLHIGQDTVEKSSMGERKVWVTLSESEMIVDTKFKNGRLLDTRRLEFDNESGEEILCTVLQLTMKGQAGSTKTVRYFRKVGEPEAEVINTPIEHIATSAGVLPPQQADDSAAKTAASLYRKQLGK